MSAQPEALRLAEQLEAIGLHGPVAAELRRLAAVEAQRDALLEALKLAADFLEHSTEFRIGHPGFEGAQAKARAAIKAVEEEA